MQQYFKWMLFIFMCLSVASCSNPNSPKGVAKSFWDAVLAQDENKAKEYVSLVTQDTIDFSRNQINWQEMRVKLGATSMLGDTAMVNTVVQNKATGVKYTFNTYLVKEQNGAWRVDYDRTRKASITSEVFSNLIESLDKFNASLNADYEDTITGFKEVAGDIKKELDNLSATLSKNTNPESAPASEFRKKFEEFKASIMNLMQHEAPAEQPAADATEPVPAKGK